jgi:beta-lactamase regulating signal transducer with metallopeptidase domain
VETVLHAGLSNALAATALAALAALGTFLFRRRPALVHGLWLLVLLKLLTPPLVRVPLPWPDPAATREAPAEPPAPPGERFAEVWHDDVGDDGAAEPFPLPDPPSDPPAATAVPPPLRAPLPPDSRAWPAWYEALPWVWLAGSCAWFAVAGARVLRFRRLLRYARPAPAALQVRAAELADELGLRRCPPVLLVPGRLAPMLWAFFGRPRLLVPERLLEMVGPRQQATLLAHELAHLRRRDHWVRGVEFLATGLYWWHPAVWYACRELREAEEQCCDAWVVSTLPGAGRSYAAALVETLDFLSAAPAAVPPLASGMGQVSDLKRRLTMIMRGTTPRALGWGGALAVLGLAALLPLVPGWARADDEDNTPNVSSVAVFGLADEPQADEPQDDQKLDDLKKAQAEIERAQAELQKKMAEVQAMREKIRAAAEKARAEAREQALKAREAARAESRAKAARDTVKVGKGEGKEVLVLESGKTGDAKKIVLKGTVEIEQTPDGKVIVRSIGSGQGQGEGASTAKRVYRIDAQTGAGRSGATGGPPPGPGGPAPDRRMRDLERRLEMLQRELEALRKEMSGGRPGARSVPPPAPPFAPVAEAPDAPPIPPTPAVSAPAPVPTPEPAPFVAPARVAPRPPVAPPAPPAPEAPRSTPARTVGS